jgi:hypothetical protein
MRILFLVSVAYCIASTALVIYLTGLLSTVDEPTLVRPTGATAILFAEREATPNADIELEWRTLRLPEHLTIACGEPTRSAVNTFWERDGFRFYLKDGAIKVQAALPTRVSGSDHHAT